MALHSLPGEATIEAFLHQLTQPRFDRMHALAELLVGGSNTSEVELVYGAIRPVLVSRGPNATACVVVRDIERNAV